MAKKSRRSWAMKKISQDLDELNARYRVRKIRPLFKNFRQKRQKLKALQQKSEAFLTRKEKHLLRRLNRAPKDAKVPALDRIYKLELDEGQSLEEAVVAYRNNPDIEYAELNYIVSIDLTPNDPLYPLQWPLNNTGQMYPEIDDNMWVNEAELNGTADVDDDGNGYIDDVYGYDFVNDDPFPKDDHGHGTHCAGIIAAEGDNALDIAGVCWAARIMALKFLSSDGFGTTADAVEAFYYAVENGADVTSNSWGGGGYSETMEEAIDYAHSQGVITVAAAGNDNSTHPHYPAYYDHVVAVAATNSNDQRAPFSNFGGWIDLAAPGVDILSLRADGTAMGTIYDDYTTVASGTSMACPHVAAVTALIISKRPNAHTQYVTTRLLDSTREIPSPGMGRGRINAFKALRYGFEGVIALNRDFYWCDNVVAIELLDLDLIGEGTHQVTVSTDGGDFETVLLTETGSALGTFTGTISTIIGAPSPEDGTIQISHGQIITVTYYDANDSFGNPAVAIDTAGVDCYPPVILDVQLGVPGREPRVTVKTDEPTTARVLCGLSCEEPYNIVGTDPCLATSHTIKLIGVSPETDYFFIVEVTDVVNYVTVDDNAGQCYVFTTTGLGDDIYVPAQCSNIQEAVDNSWDGRTVWVADGIYTGPENRDIDFKGKPISVKSENGPQHCIIDCNGTEEKPHRAFNFTNNEDANSVVAGFTITNGLGPDTEVWLGITSAGGAIYCSNASPTITNCSFVGNSANGRWASGAAIYCRHSNPTITNCTFKNNSADGQWASGGAICCENSSPAITGCTFTGNSADFNGGAVNNHDSNPIITDCIFSTNSAVGNDGGALNNSNSSPMITNCAFSANYAYDWAGAIRNVFDSSPTITNCIFTGNLAQGSGGAIFNFHNCNTIITNCTFAENSAPNGNALAFDSWQPVAPSDLQAASCILIDDGNEIWNNDGSTINITYSNVQTGWPGHGNINNDPCFVEPGYWDSNSTPTDPNDDFWIEGNYHLLQGSPCLDAGDPNYVPGPNETDLEGNPRIINERIDIGPYEGGYIKAAMRFTPQMLNCSSQGNFVKANVILPDGFSPEDVDIDKPAVAKPALSPIKTESEYIKVLSDDNGHVRLEVAFDRQAFCDLLAVNFALTDDGPLTITVIGPLTTGRYFYATGTITIIDRQ